ncbi:MAG: hypothetical protein A2Y10_12830 [Planctomycetes bacterium GWF2_41_51]|nr:MAG: hypothetical protein A2Y10_12830 [Planctomycetes bacterium GWF2_41_51]HBG28243.1 sodium:solute symporter [Phycisphaerales bacterium]
MKKTVLLGGVILFFLINFSAATTNWLKWQQMPSLPAVSGQTEPLGLAGAFIGVHNDVLIIAGGANFARPYEQTQKTWHDDILVLEKNGQEWLNVGKLGRPIAYGVSVSTKYGLLCLGGNDANQTFDNVFLLKWNSQNHKIEKIDLPSLPLPVSNMAAAEIGDVVYVAGGQQDISLSSAMKNFWSLDLSKIADSKNFSWKQLPVWPGEKRAFNITVAQHNGKEYCVYVIGGRYQKSPEDANRIPLNDVYEFSPSKYQAAQNPWKKCSNSPAAINALTGIDVGQSHILIFGSGTAPESMDSNNAGCFARNVLAYHTITDSFTLVGKMPLSQVTTTAVRWENRIVIPSGEICPRIRTPQVWQAELVKKSTVFGKINFFTLLIYLTGMIAVGAYFMRRNKSTDDFFRGGKRVPSWVAGLSIFATLLSSITFIAIPAKVYCTDWTFLMINLIGLPVAPFILIYVVPYFIKIDATSAYEYLEKRFNVAVRLFAAVSFILFHIGRMAIVMFLPALALSAMTNMSVNACILLTGILTVIYCTMGGLEAVAWTDAVQSLVLLGGAGLCLYIMINDLNGGLGEFISVASANAKFHTINWDWSNTSFYTSALWVMIIGGIGQNLVPYVSDQAIVQRYMSVSSAKKVRDSFITSIAAGLVATFLFFFIGTALYVFYKQNPQGLDPAYQNDAIFPLFISSRLPAGIAGIVVAGIFAAAQSTVSGSIHSISTVVVTDFFKRFSLLKTEKSYLILARICVLLFGVLGTALALLFASADVKSVWESFMSILGLFGGSMCGLFLLGIFTKRVGGTAAIIGAFIGAAVLFWISKYTKIYFVLYASIGIAACFISGYLVSFVIPQKQKDLSELVLDRKKSK